MHCSWCEMFCCCCCPKKKKEPKTQPLPVYVPPSIPEQKKVGVEIEVQTEDFYSSIENQEPEIAEPVLEEEAVQCAEKGLCTCVHECTFCITSPPKVIMSGTSPLPALTKPAPSFKGTAVVNGEFKEISLEDYKGKYLVLFFYPLDFTFVCPTEIIAFSDNVDKFQKLGCEVIGCSTDSHFSHLAWINTPRREGGLGEMNIPLLADKNLEISRAYGVLNEEGVAFRGLFIIDGDQKLRQITVNDLPVGRSVEETIRLVEAFQFTDKHGEVCPAGWKPGADTMKPTVDESKAYFEKAN